MVASMLPRAARPAAAAGRLTPGTKARRRRRRPWPGRSCLGASGTRRGSVPFSSSPEASSALPTRLGPLPAASSCEGGGDPLGRGGGGKKPSRTTCCCYEAGAKGRQQACPLSSPGASYTGLPSGPMSAWRCCCSESPFSPGDRRARRSCVARCKLFSFSEKQRRTRDSGEKKRSGRPSKRTAGGGAG